MFPQPPDGTFQGLDGFGLEHAAAAKLGRDLPEDRRGIALPLVQAEGVDLQRDIPFLRSEAEPPHLPAVDLLRPGKIRQIGVCKAGIAAGVQGSSRRGRGL